VAALVQGGARWIQLRDKKAGGADLLAAATAALLETRAASARLIVNDRLDVALAAGADGVHLGGDDLPVSEARRLAPDGFIIGHSTHSVAEALRAAESLPCDYVALGPIYPTSTKQDAHAVLGPEALHAVCSRIGKPLVAIGGIDAGRLPEVLEAGATAAAVVSAVMVAGEVTTRMARLLAVASGGVRKESKGSPESP
jgi:thiamine-phosphate pyrophosphorylase